MPRSRRVLIKGVPESYERSNAGPTGPAARIPAESPKAADVSFSAHEALSLGKQSSDSRGQHLYGWFSAWSKTRILLHADIPGRSPLGASLMDT